MGFFANAWKNVVYTFKSSDRYADFDSTKSATYKSSKNRSDSITNVNDSLVEYPEDGSTIDNIQDIFDHMGTSKGSKELVDAWNTIEEWLDSDPETFQDLRESLSQPCTKIDLKEAQRDLRTRFPKCVLQYFSIHDGQEISPSATHKIGLMFGLQLMTLDEVVTMTKNWRQVADKQNEPKYKDSLNETTIPQEAISKREGNTLDQDPNFKIAKKLTNQREKDLKNFPDLLKTISKHKKSKYILKSIPDQYSHPKHYIQRVYANSGWIPLITDYSGNHIGIDLNPDSEGNIGQVILFGREFDTKYLLAENWGEFFLYFANELKNGYWSMRYNQDFEDYDLVYIDKTGSGKEVSYFDILIKKCIAKYGPVDTKSDAKEEESGTTEAAIETPLVEITTDASPTVEDTKEVIDTSLVTPIKEDITAVKDSANGRTSKSNDKEESKLAEKLVDIQL